jgi:O-acetyl-ADP-ribose deacetylase (regulator of RNase III)
MAIVRSGRNRFVRGFMTDRLQINRTTVYLIKGDIADLEIDCIVHYARSDLKLGSGFGGAISGRGGMSIQKALDEMGPIDIGQAVISEAGDMKTKYIIHANGPKFQEENLEGKLRLTLENSLSLANSRGIRSIALPPMGTGFYGVPLVMSARVMFDAIKEHCEGDTSIEHLTIGVVDQREYRPFQEKLAAFQHTRVENE